MSGKRCEARVIPIKELLPGQEKEMARLYLSYYDNTNEDVFLRDLQAKHSVVLLHCEKKLVGFSTLLFYDFLWKGEKIRIVYSGDTIVEREYWGQVALPAAWLKYMGKLSRQNDGSPLYWFLLVKGHRTYKFLPAFAYEYYPDDSSDRSDLRQLAELLAQDRFGTDYNPLTGVIEFERSLGNLKTDIAYPAARELGNPAVRFFLQRNPGYLQGHELVCLCRIAADNLKPFARRIFEEGKES